MFDKDVYRYRKDLLDKFDLRLGLVDWCMQTFNENDFFITLNCPKISNLDTFIYSKVSSIEKRVFLDAPSTLYRVAVLVQKPQRHIHMLMKNIEYKHEKYSSFKDFIKKRFRRSLPDNHAVSVQTIGSNIIARVKYTLLMQEDCAIENRSLYLPPYEELILT